MGEASVEEWRLHHVEMNTAWSELVARESAATAVVVAEWRPTLAQMKVDQAGHVREGRWRSGHRTLLTAVGVHHLEVPLTAGLAWLLRPDGHHGLGSSVLVGLLTHLGIEDADPDERTRIVLEDQRDRTRADLVVYGTDWTMVIESKTFAIEQERQLDRLFERWQDDPSPAFVFLTRGRRRSTTDIDSRGRWATLAWAEVAAIVKAAASGKSNVAPGVYEYVETLEAHHNV